MLCCRYKLMEQEHQSTLEEAEEKMFRAGDFGAAGSSVTRWNFSRRHPHRKVNSCEQGGVTGIQVPSGRDVFQETLADEFSQITR